MPDKTQLENALKKLGKPFDWKPHEVPDEFQSCFTLVAKGKFPLDNIAFLLFLETVRWFSLQSTTMMWYWNETVILWKMGYRLLKDKFIFFIGGLKNMGQLVSADYIINFAVPSPSKLRSLNC